MSYTLIDLFGGTAGTALAGSTPDVGTTAWSSASAYAYTGSSFTMDGSGHIYNTASGSSLMIWPGTVTAPIEARYTLTQKSAISAHTCGMGLYSNSTPNTYYRAYFDQSSGAFNVSRCAGGAPSNLGTHAYALSNGVPVEVRVRASGTSSLAITLEVSADAGQTWTTLISCTDPSPLSGVNVAIWTDAPQTATTGLLFSNLRVGPNPTVPTLSVSPSSFTAGASGTLTLNGSGTGWIAGTPGTPTFTVAGGTGAGLSGQSITSVNAATAALNPGSTAGTLTITDPGSGATATVTVAGGTPTTYTLTPPSPASGTVNVASGSFTVAAIGTMTAPAVVTPACTPGTGTFTPATVTLSGTNPSQSFTFTSTTTGSGGAAQADTISTTNNQSLANPAGVTYTSLPVVPGPPSGLSVAAGNAQNTLTWTAPSTGGAVLSYSIFRGTSAGGESGTALATGIAASPYTDSTAANGTAYYYTAKAVNAAGSSSASNESSGTPATGPAVSPASVTIPQGGTQQLTASNFTGGAATWASSNPAVVTVNSSGVVTEVGPGSATITATGVSNTGQSASCTTTVPQVAVSVSPTTVTLGPAGTATISATVTGAVNTGVTWTSSSPTVATVDGSGHVTAVGPGSATITATASADGTKSASSAVTILNMMTTSLAFGLSPMATSATLSFYRADGSVYTPTGTPMIVAAGTTGLFIGTAQLPIGIWVLVVATDNTGATPDSQVWTGYPPAAADASGRTQVQVGTAPGQLNVAAGKVAATVAGGDCIDSSAIKATIGAAGAGLTAITLASAQSFNLSGNIIGNLSGSVGSATTIADKTGYSLATAPPTPSAIASAVVAGMATAPVGLVTSAVQVGSYAPGQDPATLLYAGVFPSSPAAHTSGSVLKQLDGMITGGVFNGTALANMMATGTVALSPAGLDAITIESGVNARQALSIVFAACGGVVSGAGTGSIVIKGGNVATTRINATTDSNGNRTAVTLALPA